MKSYRALISYGNGKPIRTIIKAVSGPAAQDAGFKKYPGARAVYITAAIASSTAALAPVKEVPVKPIPAPHPLFGNSKEDKILYALQLRREGLSYSKIADVLQVGKTTVRNWISDLSIY